MTVSEETHGREAALRELFELRVLTSDELRVELAAASDRDEDVEITSGVLRLATG